MARGTWRDPQLGDEPLGAWFRDWLATRGDLADSTHELYGRLIDHWIDAPVQVARATGHPRDINLGTQMSGSVTFADVRAWDSAVLAECIARATVRWERAQRHPRRVNAAIRVWAAETAVPVASAGRIPAALRQAWSDETGGVPATDKALDRNAGMTETAQAYRLLHTGMAQAVDDGLILANSCRVKGASQRDFEDRTDRRTVTAQEIWALNDAMPERYRASVIVAFCSGLRAGELFALQRRHVDLETRTVRVQQSLNRMETGGRLSAMKTRAGRRVVALPNVAVEALAEHMARFTAPGKDALVFSTRTGRPLTGGHAA